MAQRSKHAALHPQVQAGDRDARVVAALERVGELLRNQAWDAGASMGLSPLHVQLLAYLHGHGSTGILAVDLAARFHLTKATVSVALGTLQRKGAIAAKPSKVDGRAKDIALTAKGRRMAEEAAGHLDALMPLLDRLSTAKRDQLYTGLFEFLDAARARGMVRADRMCVTCAHYGARDGRPYCALLRKALAPQDHRVDCPEHQAA